MRTIVLALFILFAFFYSVSAQKQYILTSKHIAKADTVWVFTPTGYNAESKNNYPLVYLLHGWSGNYRQWNDIMNCQSYADKFGFIIVCPDGLYDSWYINSPAIKQSRYADFFFLDLMPFVTGKFNIDTRNTFITGLSMGGHGALYLFEQNPGLFLSAGSLSGVLDLTDYRNDYRISDYLGLKNDVQDERVFAAYSVAGNIEKIAASGKEIIFSCGTEDPFYTINNEFRTKCDNHKIKATYISGPGAHNYRYWKSAIKAHFSFFSEMVNSGK